MSKTKEYRVKLTVEKNTGGATDAAKELRGFMSTLMLVNIPFPYTVFYCGIIIGFNNYSRQPRGRLVRR